MIDSGMPRIRGRAGIAEPGQGMDGKWFYEVSLTTLACELLGPPFVFGPFDDEATAKKFGKRAIREIAEKLEKDINGKVTGEYFDFANGGVPRRWDEN